MNRSSAKTFTSSLLISSMCVALSTYSTNTIADAESSKAIAPLKAEMPYLFVVHQGRSIKVEREIDRSFIAPASIRGSLGQNSQQCPPFCLTPSNLKVPVETIAEAEIVDFMSNTLRDNKGILIDVRSSREHSVGTIPGSVNYSMKRFQEDIDDLFIELGAKRRNEVSWFTQQLEKWNLVDTSLLTNDWDFTKAKDLIIWSNDAISPLGPKAVTALYQAGYPAQKIGWYRGGIAAWYYWGFTTYKTPKKL